MSWENVHLTNFDFEILPHLRLNSYVDRSMFSPWAGELYSFTFTLFVQRDARLRTVAFIYLNHNCSLVNNITGRNNNTCNHKSLRVQKA
eukprot:scaffold7050_cov66-Skeletonema_marinoi.AAC.1